MGQKEQYEKHESLLEGFFISPPKRKNKGDEDRGNEEKGEK